MHVCCRHWAAHSVCPSCDRHMGHKCKRHRILCATCDRWAACEKCCDDLKVVQCTSCRADTKLILADGIDLPRELLAELYGRLFDMPDPSRPHIRHPTDAVVNLAGEPITDLGMLKTMRIDPLRLSRWRGFASSGPAHDLYLRSVSDLQRSGPFEICDSSEGWINDTICHVVSKQDQQDHAIRFLVLDDELPIITDATVTRPLVYEQDLTLKIAYWTFDRRDLNK